MKDLKNNIEQTCIEFGRYVQQNWSRYMSPKDLWDEFQEQQAKEVINILDEIKCCDCEPLKETK